MHHIQLKILQKLLYAESLGYAAMRPDGIESNVYAYHLEQLLQEKLIIKEHKQYYLSPAGIDFVDRLSSQYMKIRPQPFIDTAIDITTPEGKSLLFQRNFHPYFHRIGFPAGKLHIDEAVHVAAVRELREKTGLTTIPLIHRGMVYVETKQPSGLLTKKLYHVFHGDAPGELATTTPEHRGNCFWTDHTTLEAKDCMPGFLAIKALLASDQKFFFAELSE